MSRHDAGNADFNLPLSLPGKRRNSCNFKHRIKRGHTTPDATCRHPFRVRSETRHQRGGNVDRLEQKILEGRSGLRRDSTAGNARSLPDRRIRSGRRPCECRFLCRSLGGGRERLGRSDDPAHDLRSLWIDVRSLMGFRARHGLDRRRHGRRRRQWRRQRSRPDQAAHRPRRDALVHVQADEPGIRRSQDDRRQSQRGHVDVRPI